MEKSSVEEVVLGFVCDDYEAPHTIASDIARELGRPIGEAEVRHALLALAANGRVQTFAFDKKANRYLPISSSNASQEPNAWFMATPAADGRASDAS